MPETYAFDQFVLDADSFELRAAGQKVAVEPLVLDLLLVLARNPGRLITRDDLIAAIWDGRIVSESTISTAIKSARKALGDTGQAQRFIKTVRGRGIQFQRPVTAPTPPAAEDPVGLTKIAAQPALCIRVTGLDGSAAAARARALEIRLRTVLNRVPMLRIAAPLADAATLSDPRGLRERFGITHLADVTLFEAGDTLHADLGLTATLDGMQVWARAFTVPNQPAGPELLLPDIVAHLEPELMRAMIAELSQGGSADANALVLKAIGQLANRGWNLDSFRKALELLESASQLDPEIPLAHAYLALIRALGHRVGIFRDDPGAVPQAIAAAERALTLENRDSSVLGIVGCALCDAGQLARGEPILDRSIELDPANGHARTAKGAALMMRQEFEAAIPWLEEGMRISPADSRLAVWGALLAMAELICGRRDKALRAAEAACARDDRNYLPRLALAAIHAAGGSPDALTSAVRELLRTSPALRESEVLYFVGKDLFPAVWAAVTAQRSTDG